MEFDELSNRAIGCAIEVHRELGPGLLESTNEQCLAHELKLNGITRFLLQPLRGLRSEGDDHFNSAFEPWCEWRRYPPPGYMFLYTYWMDMKRDRDGNYWGNMLGPAESERVVLERGRWYCLEHMIRVNDAGQANGELAAWIDGKLYIHHTGFRWRTSAGVMLKRFDIGVYVHQARKDNTVLYDDVALSTGYIGPVAAHAADGAVVESLRAHASGWR